MCGFVGAFGNNTNKFQDRLRSAADIIRYRGPNAQGYHYDNTFIVGHNRLKIIDLSDKANQPFEDDRFILVFNGEIYNYIEIQKKFKFSLATRSDVEILFNILKRFNDDIASSINLLNGMFAFAFFDKKEKKLILCRDRLGVKPLYYSILDNKLLVFASEIKCIVDFGLRDYINHRAVINFLVNRTLSYDDRTFFKNIYSVCPGSFIYFSFDGDSFERKITKYWSFPIKPVQDIARPEALKNFRELFFDSVGIRLRSDVPMATLLSGGLDSCAVTSATAVLLPQKRVVTLSAVYTGDPLDERKYAEAVVRKYKNIEPIWINVTPDLALDVLDEVVRHQETPLPDGSMVAHFLLMKQIKKIGVRVVLTGQGGDEVLGGYTHTFLPAYYANYLRRCRVKKFNRAIVFHSLPVSYKNFLRRFFVLCKFNRYIFFKKLKAVDDFYYEWDNQTVLNSYLINSLNYWSLPGFVHYEDRNAMAQSVEARSPFLDYRLVEFMLSLSDEFKINNGCTKYILRNSFKDIIPDNILNRREKQGFYAPIDRWIKLINEDYRLDEGFRKNFNYLKFDSIGNNLIWRWRLYTLWRWYKIFCI